MNLREVLKLRGPAKSGKFKSIEIAFHTRSLLSHKNFRPLTFKGRKVLLRNSAIADGIFHILKSKSRLNAGPKQLQVVRAYPKVV